MFNLGDFVWPELPPPEGDLVRYPRYPLEGSGEESDSSDGWCGPGEDPLLVLVRVLDESSDSGDAVELGEGVEDLDPEEGPSAKRVRFSSPARASSDGSDSDSEPEQKLTPGRTTVSLNIILFWILTVPCSSATSVVGATLTGGATAMPATLTSGSVTPPTVAT